MNIHTSVKRAHATQSALVNRVNETEVNRDWFTDSFVRSTVRNAYNLRASSMIHIDTSVWDSSHEGLCKIIRILDAKEYLVESTSAIFPTS